MSLYNMVFGVNPMTQVLLSMLDLYVGAEKGDRKWPTGRFRDVNVEERDGKKVIAVFTRNGGGNRQCWDDGSNSYKGEGGRCECPGCVISNILPKHPNYIESVDDDFDSTYATIYFEVPDKFKDTIEEFYDESAMKPMDRFNQMLTNLRNKHVDDDVKRALRVGGELLKQLKTVTETHGNPCRADVQQEDEADVEI